MRKLNKIKCPSCKKSQIAEVSEVYDGNSITYVVEQGKLSDRGVKSWGYPVGLTLKCRCGHSWVLRGVDALEDIDAERITVNQISSDVFADNRQFNIRLYAPGAASAETLWRRVGKFESVTSLVEAKELWLSSIEGLGSSEVFGGDVFNEQMEVIAVFSYNGRCWLPSDTGNEYFERFPSKVEILI
ncbi:zinc ribbon domain-containing protein [Photobacterium leiognathi]|uniref:hypothetical protein n=1 Tax=Photobacterium leiognathi TaxID=553611 RepID=UPI002981BE84|nr:hypothetical protein [Photobacterium leiognathi]